MKKLFNLSISIFIAMASMGYVMASEYQMRISHQFPPNHPTPILLEQFAKDVAQSTNNQVEVRLYGSSQLFKPNQQHAAVAGGEIEAAIILSIQWGSSFPEMSITQLPFMMSSIDKQQEFITSKVADELNKGFLKKGIRNIGWILDAPDEIFTSAKHPLDSPSQFNNVKMRGYNKLFDNGLIAMGASTVSMPGSEVYQALQTGVVDAAVTAPKAAYTRKYPEVQKYGVIIPVFPVFDNLTVNPTWWDGLPDDIQGGILSAAEKAVNSSFDVFRDSHAEDVKNLEEAGMTITVINDEEVLQEFKEYMYEPVKEAYLKATGKKVGQELLNLFDEQ